MVETEVSEIPLERASHEVFLMQPDMKLGVGGAPLVQSDLSKAHLAPTSHDAGFPISARENNPPREPPEDFLSSLGDHQRLAFRKLWKRMPPHLHEIKIDFEKVLWTAADLDALGDLLFKYEHRFSHYSTDLGHVTVDPFRIILKSDARPVKQRPYRHSPVLAAKVQTEIDELVLAGILRRSYSNWSSPLVVIAKSDGRMRITCN